LTPRRIGPDDPEPVHVGIILTLTIRELAGAFYASVRQIARG